MLLSDSMKDLDICSNTKNSTIDNKKNRIHKNQSNSEAETGDNRVKKNTNLCLF